MDDAVLWIISVFFSLFIACCINNNLSVRWRTINSWLLNWMMQFQHRCGVGRAGHVQCVYISLYMCIYSIPELSVYELFWGCAPPPPQPWDVCIQARHMTPRQEGVTASEQCSFCRLCLCYYAREAACFFFCFGECTERAGGRRDFCSVWMYRSSSRVKVRLYRPHLRAFGWDQDLFALNLHQVLLSKPCRISVNTDCTGTSSSRRSQRGSMVSALFHLLIEL